MARGAVHVYDRFTPYLVAAMLVAITLLHYLTNAHLLAYHSIYRSLYYLPIAISSVVWGLRGGLATSLVTTLLYGPYVLLWNEAVPGRRLDNLLEVLIFNVVAVLTGTLADAQRRQRQHSQALSTYIEDVLISLPVGVATVSAGDAPSPRNPIAVELLRGLRRPDELPVGRPYYEIDLAGQPVGVHCSPLHKADGSIVGHVFVLEDLREQRRLAEQARQAERLAAQGQLASALAHEVRNPLAIVRATTQLLAPKLRNRPDVRVHVEVLTTEVDRIDRLIGELLAYASPRRPEPAALAPADLVHDLLTSFGPYAAQHDVTLHVDVAPTLPLVHADREQLRQALLNLLLNAVQFSQAGQAVRLRCFVEAERLCFGVRDHGPGIPPQVHQRIFDPFFTRRDDGTGLGLAVVARIAADHEGTIVIQDAPGGGTEALLCLRYEQDRQVS
jgi:two-component system sensor histidine kinase AtoS